MRLQKVICGMKALNRKGELERTKRMVAAAYVLWEAKQGIRRSGRGGFHQRLDFGRRQTG